jgi:hypothetical protein
VQEFFQDCAGLRISSNFKTMILDAAQTCLLRANGTTIGYADFVEPANDTEIGAELPAGHVFTDVNVFLVVLAALIEAQWMNEGEGPLIATGYANIFYVKIGEDTFAVDVYWDSDDSEWDCLANHLGYNRWRAEDRAFSATDAVV